MGYGRTEIKEQGYQELHSLLAEVRIKLGAPRSTIMNLWIS